MIIIYNQTSNTEPTQCYFRTTFPQVINIETRKTEKKVVEE